MQIGKRLIYNAVTGTILNNSLEKRIDLGATKEILDEIRPQQIDFIDIDYNDKTLENALEYHVDVKTKKLIIDKYNEHIETEEEKLRKEKEQVENLLLMKADENLGGIL